VTPNIGIGELLKIIAKNPSGHATMGAEMATLAIAICERLEMIHASLEGLKQAVLSSK